MANRKKDDLTLKDILTVLTGVKDENYGDFFRDSSSSKQRVREEKIKEIERKLSMTDPEFQKRQEARKRKDAQRSNRPSQRQQTGRGQNANLNQPKKERALSFSERRRLEEQEEERKRLAQSGQTPQKNMQATSSMTGAAQRSRQEEAAEQKRQLEMTDNENAPFEIFTDLGVSFDGTPMEIGVEVSAPMAATTALLEDQATIASDIQQDFTGPQRQKALQKAIVYAEIFQGPKSRQRR